MSEVLGWPKALLLMLLVLCSVASPSFLARVPFFAQLPPATFAVLNVLIVAAFAWAFLSLFFSRDLGHKNLASTVVLLGLIAGHVTVYEVSDKLPEAPVLFLFAFIFYYHFSALEIFA